MFYPSRHPHYQLIFVKHHKNYDLNLCNKIPIVYEAFLYRYWCHNIPTTKKDVNSAQSFINFGIYLFLYIATCCWIGTFQCASLNHNKDSKSEFSYDYQSKQNQKLGKTILKWNEKSLIIFSNMWVFTARIMDLLCLIAAIQPNNMRNNKITPIAMRPIPISFASEIPKSIRNNFISQVV